MALCLGDAGAIRLQCMYRRNLTHQAWLEAFVAERGGTAGSVHVQQGDDLLLTAEHNLPAAVIDVVAHVPRGKGMAGQAQVTQAPVQTCNLQADNSGRVAPGARAVDARAGIALPVFDDDGAVRAVVGIAWDAEGEIAPEDERAMLRAVETLPR